MRLSLGVIATFLTLLSGTATRSMDGPSAARPVGISVQLLATQVNGPTSSKASAGGSLEIGEHHKMLIAFRETGDGCVSVTGSGITAQVEEEVRSEIDAGDGYEWLVEVRLESRSESSAILGVSWVRTRFVADEREVTVGEQELELRLGDRRRLEAVPFDPPSDSPSCRYDSLSLDLEVSPVPHPEMAERDLAYELWVAATEKGRYQEFVAAEILSGQAEKVSFTLPALRHRIEVFGRHDDAPAFRAQCKGEIRAWSLDRERVAIEINPGLHHWIEGSRVRGSSGRGWKRFETRLGETVELRIPPPRGVVGMQATQFGLPIPLDGSVERSGSMVRIDLAKALADVRYSLLVRVRSVD